MKPSSSVLVASGFEFAAGFDDGGFAVLVAEVDAAVGVDRRGGVLAADAFFPDDVAGGGVDAVDDAVVADHVDQAVDQERRGGFGDAGLESPENVSVSVTSPVPSVRTAHSSGCIRPVTM